MAATLLTADRSSARTAAPVPAFSAFDAGEPSALTEAVFRVIADGRGRSLDEIAAAVQVRTPAAAIADEVERLRHYGLPIVETGAVVTAAPIVPLDHGALIRALNGDRRRATWKAEVVFSTRSTNADLLAAVRAGLPVAPVIRIAELQLAGRGRLGRRWSSAPGTSLTASYALTVRRRLSELDGATLVCGLAVHEVLAGLGVRARLKWPNDVLVDDRKVAGILVEAHAAGASSVLVIGIGVNVAGASDDVERPGGPGALGRTTLEASGASGIDRHALAARLATSLETHMGAFEAGGFDGFVRRWNEVDAFADRTVTLEVDAGTRRTGTERGVDARGALLVDVDGRRQRIVAGDVSLRPADGDST